MNLHDTTRRLAQMSGAGPALAASLTLLTESRGPQELRDLAASLRNLATAIDRVAAARIDIPYGAPAYAEPTGFAPATDPLHRPAYGGWAPRPGG